MRGWVTSSLGQETGDGGRGHQPAAPQNDRRHDDPQLRSADPADLHSIGAVVLPLLRSAAGGADLRGRAADISCILASAAWRRASVNGAMVALRFFFRVTLRRPEAVDYIPIVRAPQRLPVVLNRSEVARLLEATPSLKWRTALSVAYGAGLRASEVVGLKVSDIDSERMRIRVEQGKGRRDRDALLSPHLLKTLAGLVEDGAPASVAVPEPPQRLRTRDAQGAEPGLPRRPWEGSDQEGGQSAYASPLLCHPPFGAGRGRQNDPSPAGP